ncbi:hypothetical protein DICPUDRAFT_58914 [Dictyostelium purpureum]|uniref:THH1/TOM1/TOM3 domain-containing protein n=1 Tax=Dictyostelium purpureum TaxID=5786 RepID=F1A3J0_DICPU|nr:uncharacterized protein DICPUDRAFT_58914 [Dictyostelium purpureum]EGC29241.1 hypothetical protein DICPUDRAFT_58914 [Dictyostelium purpureum]|eukprot:XP_003294233.1 hypothetical protein DICPUDRAFT_58914 [Dictyostelium purpureum]
MSNNTIHRIVEPKKCYCEPSFQQKGSECNPAGCKTISVLIIVGFLIPLCICIYRFKQMKGRKDSRWSILSLTLLTITCLARIIRSILTLLEEDDFIIMGLLFLLPLGILICSFFNTLYVWVKIIYHINFSKLVTKIFPFLGKIFLGSQVILMILLIVACFAGWQYSSSNIILLVFLVYGGVSAVIFTKMIWDEYKDLSSKDCGVFSAANHQRIKKIFKLSITAIFVTFFTFGLTIWSFVVNGVLTIPHAIAFNFIGRAIEIAWISVMLVILAPQLQTWDQNSNRTAGNKESINFDSLSDSSIDIENDPEDNIDNNTLNTNSNNNSSPLQTQPQPQTQPLQQTLAPPKPETSPQIDNSKNGASPTVVTVVSTASVNLPVNNNNNNNHHRLNTQQDQYKDSENIKKSN